MLWRFTKCTGIKYKFIVVTVFWINQRHKIKTRESNYEIRVQTTSGISLVLERERA